jgi:hypothetical protein
MMITVKNASSLPARVLAQASAGYAQTGEDNNARHKHALLKMAEDYDRLAMAAEERLRKQKRQRPAK